MRIRQVKSDPSRQRAARADAWTLAHYQRLAKRRGGRLLTRGKPNVCPRVIDVLRLRCSEGHEWDVVAAQFKYGSWCPVCKRHRGSWNKERFAAFADERGGKLISTHLPGAVQHLHRVRFQCDHGHEWDVYAGQVMQRQTWCRICSNRQRLKPNDDIAALCANRSGRIVEAGRNRMYKWVFQCAKGHEFEARPGDVQNGSWCPQCSASRPERLVRTFFEQIFGRPFPKVRPKWLRNTTGFPLELDGYCEELRLAFEHQGTQHYRARTGRFADQHAAIRKRDKRKRVMCRKRGVTLIEVPDLLRTLKLSELQSRIILLCDAAGFAVPESARSKIIEIRATYATTRDDDQLQRVHQIAQSRGGKCCAAVYVGASTPMPFECAAGHSWLVRPADVISGTWCMKCARADLGKRKRHSIKSMHALAKSRGGKCLSDEYVSALSTLEWKCVDCGHEWKATPSSVIGGSWCRRCCFRKGWELRRKKFGKRGQRGRPGPSPKYSIADMRKLAAKRGGECLSKTYVNAFTKLKWRCGECRHAWLAAPGDVRRGTWCPACAIDARRLIKSVALL